MSKLIHLPNINGELESKLINAGITTPEALREKGSRHTFVKIKTEDSSACFEMLLALEGAVQGKLIDDLNDREIEDLRVFMEIFNR
jgi:DNA transformation protein